MKNDSHVDREFAENAEFREIVDGLRERRRLGGGWVELTQVRSKAEAALVFPYFSERIDRGVSLEIRYYLLRSFRVKWAAPWLKQICAWLAKFKDPPCELAIGQSLAAISNRSNAVEIFEAASKRQPFEYHEALFRRLLKYEEARPRIIDWLRGLEADCKLFGGLARIFQELKSSNGVPIRRKVRTRSQGIVKAAEPEALLEALSEIPSGLFELWSGECELGDLDKALEFLEVTFAAKAVGAAQIQRALIDDPSGVVLEVSTAGASPTGAKMVLCLLLEDEDTVLFRLLGKNAETS